jgi:RimJ/RimL family protein N-acetyltransferase
MKIATRRLLLRDFVPDDLAALAAYHADPRYRESYPPGEDRPDELLQRFLTWAAEKPRRNYQLAIDRHGLIGCVGVRTEGPGHAEFGIELAPAEWKKGYATEAARAILAFGFRDLGLEEIRAVSSPQNDRAARLVQRLGFRRIDADGRIEWRLDQGAFFGGRSDASETS